MQRTALITGASRGIGFEISRQLALAGLKVLASARSESKATEAADKLAALDAHVTPVVLDMAASHALSAQFQVISAAHGPIDVVINNAAIFIDAPGGFSSSLFDLTDDVMLRTWTTNVLGPAALLKVALPSMMQRGYGRVVNVSSRAGQLSNMQAGFPAYRMSKSALNALTRIAAAEVLAKAPTADIKINAVCPGWVRTDMGGKDATRSVIEGAETPVWLAMLPQAGPTGGFFHDKSPVAW